MTTKDLDLKKATNIATARPDFLGESRVGSENVSYQDLEIPRIGIIQDLSPQRKKSDTAYIPGAEEGMMFNTVTGELYRGALLVIPVYYRKEWILWVDRKAGGGFRGAFDSLAEADAFKRTLDEPAEAIETAQNFCLFSADDGKTWSEAVLSMSKSGLSVARKWNSMIQLKQSDRFGQVYKVAPIQKTNPKGNYFIFGVTWAGWATQEWYEAGKRSYQSIKDGSKTIARYTYENDEHVNSEF